MNGFLLGVVVVLLVCAGPFALEIADSLGKAVLALMVVAFLVLPFCFGAIRRLGR